VDDFGGVQDAGITEVLAHDIAVSRLDQAVVVGSSGVGLGEFVDVEFFEQLRDAVADVRRALVSLEVADGERELAHQAFKDE